MAKTLRTKMDLGFEWTYTNTDADSGRSVTDSNAISVIKTLSSGVAIDNADLQWNDRRTVNDAANDDLDLAGGLTDAFGATLTFAKIKGIVVYNRNTTAGHMLHIGGGSNTFNTFLGADGDIIKVGPDGLFVIWNPSLAGYAVTASTGDILRLSGSGGDITYDIAIIGTSA